MKYLYLCKISIFGQTSTSVVLDFHVCHYASPDTKAPPSMVSRKTRSMVHMRVLTSCDIDEGIRPDGLQICFSRLSLKNPCFWDESQRSLGTEVEIRAAFALFGPTWTNSRCAGVPGHCQCWGENWMKRSNGAPDCFETNLPHVESAMSEKEEGTTDWTAPLTSMNDSTFSSCSFFHPGLKERYIEPPRLKTPTCYFLFKVLTFSFLSLSGLHFYPFVWRTCKYRSI